MLDRGLQGGESSASYPPFKVIENIRRIELAGRNLDCNLPGSCNRNQQDGGAVHQDALNPRGKSLRSIQNPKKRGRIQQIGHFSGCGIGCGTSGASSMYPKPLSTNSASVIGSKASSSQRMRPRYAPANLKFGSGCPVAGSLIGTILATGFAPRLTMTSLPAS